MSHAGWGRLWNEALALFGAAPVVQRLFIMLFVAFVVLMIVEGLRASFVPVRPAAHRPKPAKPQLQPQTKTSDVKLSIAPRTPFRPRSVARCQRKPLMRVRQQQAERPRIHRFVPATEAPLPIEEYAPFTPLPASPQTAL